MMSMAQSRWSRPSSGLGMAVLLAATFVIASVAFSFWNWTKQPDVSRPECRSTAVISLGRPRSGSPVLLLEQISQETLSSSQLRQAIEAVDGPRAVSDESVAQLGKVLAIEPETGDEGQRLIRISCLDCDRARAARLANEVARRWTEMCRNTAKADAEQAHTKARQAADEAQRQYQQAKSNLDGYLERHFREHESLARRLKAAAPAIKPSVVVPGPVADAVPADAHRAAEAPARESPQRVALQREVAELKRSLTQMLTVRTSMHPEVQDLEAQIRDLTRKLESLPQQGTGRAEISDESLAKRQQPVPAAVAPPRDNNAQEARQAAEHAEAAQTYWGLIADLQRASERQQATSAAERIAWEEQTRGPQIQVSLAPLLPSESTPAVQNYSPWTVLAAALAIAAGIAMIFSGFATDRSLQTPQEVESATRLPVVGVLRIADLGAEPEEAQRQPRTRSMTWIAAGLLLVLACLIAIAHRGHS